MMKKQPSNTKDKTIVSCGPTCGNCIHNPSGHRCCIYPDWAVLPSDPANSCEYHFPRVEKRFLRYYKHRPVFTKGWPDTDMEKYWAYLKDLRRGIISDNNGGYFTRYPWPGHIDNL